MTFGSNFLQNKKVTGRKKQILSGKSCLAPLCLGEICLCINRNTGEQGYYHLFIFTIIPLTTLADHLCAHCKTGHEITSLSEGLLITDSDKVLRTTNSEIDITFTYYSIILTNIQLFQKYHAIPHKRQSESCCIGPLCNFHIQYDGYVFSKY